MHIQRVLIIGAGWTGRQIAGQMAAFGVDITMIDNNRAALEASLAWIESQRPSFVDNGYWPEVESQQLMARIQTAQSLEGVDGSFDLILESASEQFSLKRRLFQTYSKRFPPPTILASNSSYFTPSLLQPHVSSPERFAHFHFHVPIWIATLVDIAPCAVTDTETIGSLVDLAKRIGQTPLVQNVENPGYVFNWMLKALLQSALQLVDRKVASPADIDMAWKKVTGMPIGPFGMMDQIGIDLIHQTMSHARFVEGDQEWQPLIDILQPYIDSHCVGVKTGQGFFRHDIGSIRHKDESK
ncbi:MAG: 3-hydroxyacyl-CoA dehydrogenase NAD-binding domain-containing protein [Pirellula sp.]